MNTKMHLSVFDCRTLSIHPVRNGAAVNANLVHPHGGSEVEMGYSILTVLLPLVLVG